MDALVKEERLKLIGDDLGELIQTIQESFWVAFTEDEILEATTIGALFDCVIQKTGDLGSPSCLSSVAFFRLRQELVEISGRDRRSIVQHSSLHTLIPWRLRRAWWETLQNQLRLSFPPLQPGGWLLLSLFLMASGIALLLHWHGSLLAAIGTAFLIWILSLLLVRPLYREFPNRVRTFEQLVRAVVARNHQKLAMEAGGSTQQQAWQAFRELVGDAAGIASAKIERSMRFPEDLRIY